MKTRLKFSALIISSVFCEFLLIFYYLLFFQPFVKYYADALQEWASFYVTPLALLHILHQSAMKKESGP